MDELGIDRAVLTTFSLYPDARYELASMAAHPDRFGLCLQIDFEDAHPAETLRRLKNETDLVAIRASFLGPSGHSHFELVGSGSFRAWLDAAEAVHVPVMLSLPGHTLLAPPVVSSHPDLTFVIDHLGLPQPPIPPLAKEPFAGFDDVLRLSEFANVGIKLTGAPTLSHEAFPFPDILENIRRLVDTFGKERVMWGSDFTRTAPFHNYHDALHYLSDSPLFTFDEKEWLLGRSLRGFLGWRARDDEAGGADSDSSR